MRRYADEREAAATRRQGGRTRPPAVSPSPAEQVLLLQRSAGNRALVRLLAPTAAVLQRSTDDDLAAEIARAVREEAAIRGRLQATRSQAEQLVRRALGREPPLPVLVGTEAQKAAARRARAAWVTDELQNLIDDGYFSDVDRAEALARRDKILEIEEEARRAKTKVKTARNKAKKAKKPPRGGGGGGGAEEPGAKAEESAAKAEESAGKSAGKAEQSAASTAGKEAESAAVKEAEQVAVKEAESAAAKELGKATAEAAAKGSEKLYKRVLGKIGRAALELLIPDPTDALVLMWDFAGSYFEAWNRIKRDNLENGFAIGLAAYLIVPRWDWARYHARTTVSRDVATQVVGAVGIAENAYNEGLVRGFIYGEKHSKAQADRLRQLVFNALVKADRMPGHYEGDDVYTFRREDVYAFAVALQPTAVAVLKEADRRREARIHKELKESGSVGMKV